MAYHLQVTYKNFGKYKSLHRLIQHVPPAICPLARFSLARSANTSFSLARFVNTSFLLSGIIISGVDNGDILMRMLARLT